MRFYKCECGHLTSFGSDIPAPCRVCEKCGTTLSCFENFRNKPAPHHYVTMYDKKTGLPKYKFCEKCYDRVEL